METSTTKNTKIHNPSYESCGVVGCPVEADLVAIQSTYLGLRITIPICQKHLGGKR